MRFPLAAKPGNACSHKAVGISIADAKSTPLCKEHFAGAKGDKAPIGDPTKSDLVCFAPSGALPEPPPLPSRSSRR